MTNGSDNKYYIMAKRLSEDICGGVYGVGDLLPSEANLSEAFGVSRVTVRSALGVLRDEGLIVSHAARGWQVSDRGEARKIVALLSGINASRSLFEAMELVCRAHGAQCVLKPCPGNNAILKDPIGMLSIPEDADAVALFLDARPNEELVAYLKSAARSVLLVGLHGHAEFDSVCCDFAQGSDALVEYLWARGHRRIAYFEMEGRARVLPSFMARRNGYELAMRARGEAPLFLTMAGDFPSRLDSEHVLKAWLEAVRAERGALPDAIVLSECQEMGPLACLLRHAGLRMPQDLSLCSFGTPGFAVKGDAVEFKNLTVFEEPWSEIGRQAAAKLFSRLEFGDCGPSFVMVPSRVVEGDSAIDRVHKAE